ncbi:MAG: deoxyribonuclease IV [Gemmatimonadetes bacterium]|nr:deoxyribonuclease IV [Gemmatimonadota bacterium]
MTGAPLLGAHVSVAGGIERAPQRGAAINATAIQVFTKTPNQWRERRIGARQAARFREALLRHRIRAVVAHDAYLINLASPDPGLRARSIRAFQAELERCRRLGIPYLVTHPGHFLDDRRQGLMRNAAAYEQCLATVPGPTILVEATAGAGTALGSRFEELAELRETVRGDLRPRVAFCADTCHLFAAGYDLVAAWDDVWTTWNRVIGLAQLRCVHVNDSQAPLGSRRDRHAWIGEGKMGPEPFRRLMRDARFTGVIKIIETPKGGDAERHDRRMLRRLRGYARAGARLEFRPPSRRAAPAELGNPSVGVGL